MVNCYGEQVYEDGYWVYIIIICKNQQVVQQVVCNNVLDYDMCYGYCGLVSVLWKVGEMLWEMKKIVDLLKCQFGYGLFFLVVVIFVNVQEVVVLLVNGNFVLLMMEGVCWVCCFIFDMQ